MSHASRLLTRCGPPNGQGKPFLSDRAAQCAPPWRKDQEFFGAMDIRERQVSKSSTWKIWVVSLDSVYEYERAISEHAHGTLLMHNTRSASGESHGVHYQLLSAPPMHALWTLASKWPKVSGLSQRNFRTSHD